MWQVRLAFKADCSISMRDENHDHRPDFHLAWLPDMYHNQERKKNDRQHLLLFKLSWFLLGSLFASCVVFL